MERDNFEDIGGDGRVKNGSSTKRMRGAWTALAQHLGRWRALVNVVMKYQFP